MGKTDVVSRQLDHTVEMQACTEPVPRSVPSTSQACGLAMTLFTIGTDLDPQGLTVYGDKLDQDFALRFVVREGELIGYGYYGPEEVRFVDDYRAPAGGRDAFVAGLTRPAGLSWLRRWGGRLRSIAAPSASRIVVATTVLDDARLTSLSL